MCDARLTPGKSYADAVLSGTLSETTTQSGILTPRRIRRRLSDYITPTTRDDTSDNLLIQEVNATKEKNQLTQLSNTSITNTSYKINKKRNRWTKVERMELYKCYLIALKSKLPALATKGTFTTWRKRNPNIHPTMKRNTLNTARRYAKQMLTSVEMENIKMEVESNNPLVISGMQFPNETPSGTYSELEVNHPNNSSTEQPARQREMNAGMKAHLIVMFDKHKCMELSERVKPKKYRMNKENEEKIEDINNILTEFLNSNPNLTITELNTLHYTAAVVLAGTVEKPTHRNRNVNPYVQ